MQAGTLQSFYEIKVIDKLSAARNILPPDLWVSEPAKHIRSITTDISSNSATFCELDKKNKLQKNDSSNLLEKQQQNLLNKQFKEKYGTKLRGLLKHRDKIVFVNDLAQQILQNADQQYLDTYFGSIDTDLIGKSKEKKKQQSQTHFAIAQKNYQLKFEDQFQSSNLFMVLSYTQNTFIIMNRFDFNTSSYGQWFYFKVIKKLESKKKYKFIIVNMTKSSSMFGKGLKISVCRNNIWGKEGTEISYFPNNFEQNKNIFKGKEISEYYHSLTFCLEIGNQQVYIAYNQPYTYSKLNTTLSNLLSKSTVQQTQDEQNNLSFIKKKTICRTHLDNRVDMLSITLPNSKKKNSQKSVIFVMARAHPVETAGSFVMQGFIEEFFKKPMDPNLIQLLENFIIKIIPMINPDGVILGNSRCNFKGFDLNRKWNCPDKYVPEVKQILKAVMKYQSRVQMFIDLHAHSKKKNVFAYGCHDSRKPYASRQFPFLLSQISENDFLFSECRFTSTANKKILTNKQGTARLTLWRKLRIHNIFTIEHSYCSASGSSYHYDQEAYKKIGKKMLEGICLYCLSENKIYYASLQEGKLSNSTQSERYKQLNQRPTVKRQYLLKSLYQDKKNIEIGLAPIQDSQSQSQQHIPKRLQTIFQKKRKCNQVSSSINLSNFLRDNRNPNSSDLQKRMKSMMNVNSTKNKQDQKNISGSLGKKQQTFSHNFKKQIYKRNNNNLSMQEMEKNYFQSQMKKTLTNNLTPIKNRLRIKTKPHSNSYHQQYLMNYVPIKSIQRQNTEPPQPSRQTIKVVSIDGSYPLFDDQQFKQKFFGKNGNRDFKMHRQIERTVLVRHNNGPYKRQQLDKQKDGTKRLTLQQILSSRRKPNNQDFIKKLNHYIITTER